MTRFTKHIVCPLYAPFAIYALYLTPKHVFGCANRGLMALAVVLVATALSAACTAKALKNRTSPENLWWVISGLILLLPGFLLIGPLG